VVKKDWLLDEFSKPLYETFDVFSLNAVVGAKACTPTMAFA
jgi:hypothetical protein